MSKNLVSQYREYNSVRRSNPNININSSRKKHCITCGAELIDNTCADCEIKDTKARSKIKKKF
jgi:hypothetical protein